MKNTGTLITSTVRPNDSLDPISVAYATEIKGGLHSVNTKSDRDNIIFERREWGMLCFVLSEDKTYQLMYNYKNDDIKDNLNWKEILDSYYNNEWFNSVLSIITDEPEHPGNGDRYIMGLNDTYTLTGPNWSNISKYYPGWVVEWISNLNDWKIVPLVDNMTLRVKSENNSIYRFSDHQWNKERSNQIIILNFETLDDITYSSSSSYFNINDHDIIILAKFDQSNESSSVFLTINNLLPISVKKPSPFGLINLKKNDIVSDVIYKLVYNGNEFQLDKPFDDIFSGNKYYIEPDDYILVPEYHQYWVYGNLTIEGTLINKGRIIIVDGDYIINGGNFINEGEISLLSINNTPTTYSFTSSNTIDFDIIGSTISAYIKDSSITASKFDSVNNEQDGYVMSYDESNNKLKWVPNSSTQLSVTDYNTNNKFESVSNIIFRGGSINTIDGNKTASLVTSTQSNVVVVWIPSPEYAHNFSPVLYNDGEYRYIMSPYINGWTSSNIKGYYGVGDWDIYNDFVNDVTRKVISDTNIVLFKDDEFSIMDYNTNLKLKIYNYDESVLYSIDYQILGNGVTQSNGILIELSNFTQDNDRYKASVQCIADLSVLLPNGGRFSYNVEHNNGLNGVYSFTASEYMFYEMPYQSITYSTSKISNDVTFNELSPILVYYSGVAFYYVGTTFNFEVSGIDYLNETTIPTTKQISIISNNIPISDTNDGYANGIKSVGSHINGWTHSSLVSGLTYSGVSTIDVYNRYYPGFGINNSLSGVYSSIGANLYDWELCFNKNSETKKMLFDTYLKSQITYNNNPIDSEDNRYYVDSIGSTQILLFNSYNVLPNSELQYLFGRIIYPQSDFSEYLPSVNSGVNYESLSGSNLTFSVYNNINIIGGSFSNITFNDYRWYVSVYGKSLNYTTSFNNGIFTLDSNFYEDILHYDGVNLNNGTGDLVLLIGLDSSGYNNNPDRFIFLSGDPNVRVDSNNYNLNYETSSSKNIKFTFGILNINIRKIWLLIGYKNTSIGKNLKITNIKLS